MGARACPAAAWARALLAAVLLLVPAWPAAARQDGAGEIDLAARWFGVGGVVRPGDWAGLQLTVQDSAARQRDVLLRITLPDADGDDAEYETTITTNPGVAQPAWMYVVLPHRFRPQDVVQVQAFSAVERGDAGPRGPGYVAGRLLGSTRLQPRRVIARTDGLMGVVGSRALGLTRYAGDGQSPGLPGAHERTEVVTGLNAEGLPDRWTGLAAFETIVWHEPSPASLGSARAAALREWVERGGHLVVVLPRVGQAWTDEVNNPLWEITPRVVVERREGVDLEPVRLLVTSRREVAMPRSEVTQVFRPAPGAGPDEARAILAWPSGDWLAVRRTAGVGAVTLVGLDVGSRWMTERAMPEPEMFWHRILGRRGELVQPREGDPAAVRVGERDPITLDRDVGDQIAKTGRAEIGVLVGLVVFVVYWLVAGPIGFGLLRRTGRAQHGWLAFVAAAGLFTAIAWGGAAALRPQRVDVSHLTIIDHVYGQPVQRARSWVSVLIPTYGEATIGVGEPEQAAAGRSGGALSPFEPDNASSATFPDARGYRIDSRDPDQTTIPTRGTVKQFQVDWAGGPRWRMPRPVGDGQPELRLLGRSGERTTTRQDRLRVAGTLVHDLPAPLSDVVVIVNRGQRHLTSALGRGGPLLADVAAFKLAAPWAPGEPLDLGRVTDTEIDTDYFRTLIQSDVGPPESVTGGDGDTGRAVARLTAIALLHQLQPPETRGADVMRRERLAQRRVTHGFDLGRWFTQPCVIVLGQVGARDAGPASPVPLWVSTGGARREPPSAGRTVVRWVYPLPADPPLFPARDDPPPPEDRPSP